MFYTIVKAYVLQAIKDHPDKKIQITDRFWLAIEIVDQGGDPSQEYKIAWHDIQGIINQ